MRKHIACILRRLGLRKLADWLAPIDPPPPAQVKGGGGPGPGGGTPR